MCVTILCATSEFSVVLLLLTKDNHRDTENSEVAQRDYCSGKASSTSTVHGTVSGSTPCCLAHLCSAQGCVSTSRYSPSNWRVTASALASSALSGCSR